MSSLAGSSGVRLDYHDLLSFTAGVFAALGLASERASTAAEALCYGDLTGHSSHGLVNLTRLYLPLFEDDRVDPTAELEIVVDRDAAALVDARQGLGLWVASEAMQWAVSRARRYGIGLMAVRQATHFGCAGYHASKAVAHGMLGVVASNCGGQRIAPPPGGTVALLGTNPLSVAAPAGTNPPFVLDMSTTAAPTGRLREAVRRGQSVPPGWLEDDQDEPVTDPGAFDAGKAHLLWLGGGPGAGRHKGFGLGLVVELLAALIPGAGLGPAPEALAGDGSPSGRDDDIGYLVAALAPGTLRPDEEVRRDAETIFDTILDCPARGETPVRYPGWYEAERARHNRRRGVPLDEAVYRELQEVADALDLQAPTPKGDG